MLINDQFELVCLNFRVKVRYSGMCYLCVCVKKKERRVSDSLSLYDFFKVAGINIGISHKNLVSFRLCCAPNEKKLVGSPVDFDIVRYVPLKLNLKTSS